MGECLFIHSAPLSLVSARSNRAINLTGYAACKVLLGLPGRLFARLTRPKTAIARNWGSAIVGLRRAAGAVWFDRPAFCAANPTYELQSRIAPRLIWATKRDALCAGPQDGIYGAGRPSMHEATAQ